MTLVETSPETTAPSYSELVSEVQNLDHTVEVLSEALSDLELAADDKGWRVMALETDREFSRDGLDNVIRNCTIMAIASPLIKRGLLLRTGYVWGGGVSVMARANGSKTQGKKPKGQDVNQVIQDFWDDESNQKALTSPEAWAKLEHKVGTQGNVVFTLFPNPLTGRVQVRTTPFKEIADTITNPEDRDEVWFHYRTYSASVVEPGYAGTRIRKETRRVLHPDLRYWPQSRPKAIDGIPVLWDQPMLHVKVNAPDHGKWGIPDAYAALSWARGYESFLTDWARLVKALSRFAWRTSGDRSDKARTAAAQLRSSLPRTNVDPAPVGAVAAMGPGQSLEAIPKTGATIDSESGRPLAAMVAAALGVSVVDLLADPGVTGARAVAESLDRPIINEMNMRRSVWGSVLQTILNYVITQSIKAPRGLLKGTVTRDPVTGRETAVLAGDEERTLEVKWPELDDVDIATLVAAIVDADSTRKLPPKVIATLLLRALKVDDVDEVLDEIIDPETGDWRDPYSADPEAA